MNRLLLFFWLIGAVLYASNGLTSPRPQCRTQGAEVIVSVAPPSTNRRTPSKRTVQGFEVIELLVPKDAEATGSIE